MRPIFLYLPILIYAAAVHGQTNGPRIVAPDAMLRDRKIELAVKGLKPDSSYSLRAEFASRAGTIWRSETEFRSDANGEIDIAKMAPVAGSYSGVDPTGILWSMQNSKERSSDGLTFDNDDHSVLNVTVRVGEKTVAQKYIILRNRDIGVSTTEIRGEVTGTFFSPKVTSRVPAVIVLGGSEGGVARPNAALVASHGFPTLALGYFGTESLPEDLERIPVETVDRAVDWLAKQPGVDPSRIVVMGGSKGAELALVAASLNPKIKGVVAIAPSSVVWEAISQSKESYSSWTSRGKDLPFAPYVQTDEYKKTRRLISLYDPSFAKAPAESQIAVERIAGPILLISGNNDLVWPSAEMANAIEARLAKNNFKYNVLNRQWDNVGHHVAGVPNRPTADSVRLGGTAQTIANAQFEAWREIVSFLSSLKR
jgi:dienelactone hydrolase